MFDVVRKLRAKIHIATASAAPGTLQATAKKALTDDEKRVFDYAWAECRCWVVQRARIVITTCSNAGNPEVRYNFAKDELDKVWLEGIDAHAIPEASILIPLALCWNSFGRKIVSIVLYGDLKQPGPFVFGGDGTSGSRKACNPFAAQLHWSLFKRLCQAGFPMIELGN